MVTRDELIDRVTAARWPVLGKGSRGWVEGRKMAAQWFDLCEPLIRADERATTKYEMGVLQWEGLRLRQERADLRAKVDALPSMQYSFEPWVKRADVLALLDGTSPPT